MNKILILIFALTASALNAFSQYRLEFESFGEDQTDLSARTREKRDLNGDPAALLKIQIPLLRDATISSPLKLGDEDYLPGELKVYLGEGTKKITVRHPDFEPFDYNFDTPLKGKCVYKLVLKVPKDYLSLGLVSVKLMTNVVDADLNIDGQNHTTSNGVFLLKLKKGDYNYTLTTSKPGYNKLEGVLSITDADLKDSGRIDRYLELQSEKRSNLHITDNGLSKITIDGSLIDNKKQKVISLPMGLHYVEISNSGYKKSFTIELIKDNEELDADIRVPLRIVSPSKAEFTVTPLGDAVKPSLTKFKAGQTVYLLGTYRIAAKAKGYEPAEFDVVALPEMNEVTMAVPMTSNAHKLYVGTNETKQNIGKSQKEYQKMIEAGDELAMWEYGLILIESGNISNGEAYIKRAADAGMPKAAVYCAEHIVNGNASEMARYLNIALEGGEQSAHQVLGDLYSSHSLRDVKKAYHEYSLYNTPYSRIRRAQIVLDNQEEMQVLLPEIIELLESIDSSDKQFPKAQNLLGEMSFRGIGSQSNHGNAIEYWSKLDPKDLSQLGLKVMAVSHLEKPELSNYLYCLDLDNISSDDVIHNGVTMIQLLTRAGQRLDKEHSSLAFNVLSKAYMLGDRSLTTLSYLGKYYKDGAVTSKNIQKAKELLTAAVEQYNDVRSMRWLGNIYENEKDIASAERYYQKAISNKDTIAKGYYATLLFNKGKKYHGQAVKYWTEAANVGHKQSIRNLIKYYEKVAPNRSQAEYWKNKL